MSQFVLLVDDDEGILAVHKFALEEHGIGVLTACDGLDALDALKENSNIGLVITDVQMPGMNGLDFLRTSRSLYPHIPVILCSGYPEAFKDWPFLYEALHVLSKPVEYDKLGEVAKAGLKK